MAERRMFAKTIIDSDAFLDMPATTQTLYFHLSMRADDEGFVNNPKKIQRVVGSSDDDLKLLIAKKFIIPFESGIVVIKHWKIHNYIRKDRLQETVYQDEKMMLEEKDNSSYTLCQSSGGQVADKCQHRLGKDRLGEVRLGEDKDGDQGSPTNKGEKVKDIYKDIPGELHRPLKDYIESRKKLRKPMTDRAIELMLKKLNRLAGGDISKSIAILEQSVMNGWVGIFELKEEKKSTNPFDELLKEELLNEQNRNNSDNEDNQRLLSSLLP